MMDASGLDVQRLFRLLDAAAAPSLSCEELACRISAGLTPQTASASSASHTHLMCLCLTLTDHIISRLSSQRLTHEVRIYYEGVMGRLCQMDLMAKLVSLLGCQDQLVSHLSAKCMSAYIISDICITGRCSSLWRHTCAEVFNRSTLSTELDSCLWSLTAVIKGLLRGDSQHTNDVLRKLLAALDASLTCLYSSLLPQDSVQPPKTTETQLCKTMCVFFDLLEVLSAARLRCGVCSSVQRTIFTESRALLNVQRTDVEYFVKKRALLLLKRALLRRAGEDWALGDVRPASHGDEGLNEDMCAVAEAVLQEVKAGWLQEVPVKAQASFFGGNCDAGVGGPQKDDVMLRAVSLILLKSLEINTQPSRVKGGTQRYGDVQRYLTQLMMFLQHHGTLSPSPHTHRCLWVSVVFSEQDDDMMESARALIALHLSQKSGSFSVPVCLWGCNPHCHFIILLRSLSFDHTVLLDFLISTETCFLEYCVRYLKLLREDWGGFCRSCGHVEDCDGKLGGSGRRAAGLVVQAQSDVSETSESSEMYISPCTSTRSDVRAGPTGSDVKDGPTGSDVRAGPIPRLVDYGSSDESDEAEESSSNNHTNRNFRNTEARFGRTEVEASSYVGKVLVCLEELKMAITRLQNRGLFPYNPTSLLKLLNSIDPKRNTVS